MKIDLLKSCGHCWVFQICWHTECSTFIALSFRIWNSPTGIPSPPLALFLVMLPKAHLTLPSRMSGSRWVLYHCGYLGHEDLFCIILLSQLCPTLCNPVDCSPPGSSVHGILQARILEWVAIPLSRGSTDPGIKTMCPAFQADPLQSEAPGKLLSTNMSALNLPAFWLSKHLQVQLLFSSWSIKHPVTTCQILCFSVVFWLTKYLCFWLLFFLQWQWWLVLCPHLLVLRDGRASSYLVRYKCP